MSQLQDNEKQVVEEFIEYGENKFGFNTLNALQLALVFAGKRDGCLIGGIDDDDVKFVESLLSNHNIPYVREEYGGPKFYVAKSERHLQKHSFADDRELGEFFGYPEDAIEAYCQGDALRRFNDFVEREIDDFANEKEFSSATPLIQYIPAPTEASVQEALDREQEYEQTLQSISIDFSSVHNHDF